MEQIPTAVVRMRREPPSVSAEKIFLAVSLLCEYFLIFFQSSSQN